LTEKLELGTRKPNPDFSLNSSGICRPCFCKYVKFSSGPVISRKRPLKLLRSYFSPSIFSSSWKVLRPSISSSPMVQSSVYNFLVRSRCKMAHAWWGNTWVIPLENYSTRRWRRRRHRRRRRRIRARSLFTNWRLFGSGAESSAIADTQLETYHRNLIGLHDKVATAKVRQATRDSRDNVQHDRTRLVVYYLHVRRDAPVTPRKHVPRPYVLSQRTSNAIFLPASVANFSTLPRPLRQSCNFRKRACAHVSCRFSKRARKLERREAREWTCPRFYVGWNPF